MESIGKSILGSSMLKAGGKAVGKMAYDNKEAIGNYAYQNKEKIGQYAYDNREQIASTYNNNQEFIHDVGKGAVNAHQAENNSQQTQSQNQSNQNQFNPLGPQQNQINQENPQSYQAYPKEEEQYNYGDQNYNQSDSNPIPFSNGGSIQGTDPENFKCFDCSSPNPDMASVNNGIFICTNCQAIHQSYGDHISWIKSINQEHWTENDKLYMSLGGNSNAAVHFQTYYLMDGDAYTRLNSDAAKQYRKNLQILVESKNQQYQKYSGTNQNESEKDQNIFEKGFGFLSAGAANIKKTADDAGITDKMKQGKNYMSQKAEEHRVKEKLSYAGQVTKEKLNEGAQWTKQKAVEHELDQKASNAGKATKEGAMKMGASMSSFFKNIVADQKASNAGGPGAK